MTAITIDTHKFVRILKDAGVQESQSEAFSEAFKDKHDLAINSCLSRYKLCY